MLASSSLSFLDSFIWIDFSFCYEYIFLLLGTNSVFWLDFGHYGYYIVECLNFVVFL